MYGLTTPIHQIKTMNKLRKTVEEQVEDMNSELRSVKMYADINFTNSISNNVPMYGFLARQIIANL